MNTYKVIYARNAIISCDLLPHQVKLNGKYYFEQKKGQLIYAIIEAESMADAMATAEQIVREVTEATFGKDFVA